MLNFNQTTINCSPELSHHLLPSFLSASRPVFTHLKSPWLGNSTKYPTAASASDLAVPNSASTSPCPRSLSAPLQYARALVAVGREPQSPPVPGFLAVSIQNLVHSTLLCPRFPTPRKA
ncbi:hypothetical protein PGTUg99_018657 [Puccinia graminis f. sp. tritici]|uniref:Uncharacterized protein n=1 Tax=Puccinia graminis f. sp. tritici TaxID=56615 RepID=A0A5B0MZ07_PUCGR|nr:hypothetical protein PGTUg99_018657 [Puccinia graminis f. sp. tritici]